MPAVIFSAVVTLPTLVSKLVGSGQATKEKSLPSCFVDVELQRLAVAMLMTAWRIVSAVAAS